MDAARLHRLCDDLVNPSQTDFGSPRRILNVSPHLQFSARSFAQLIFRSQNVDLIDAKVDSLCCGNAAGGRGASSDGAED
jgi:hypothetical protein